MSTRPEEQLPHRDGVINEAQELRQLEVRVPGVRFGMVQTERQKAPILVRLDLEVEEA